MLFWCEPLTPSNSIPFWGQLQNLWAKRYFKNGEPFFRRLPGPDPVIGQSRQTRPRHTTGRSTPAPKVHPRAFEAEIITVFREARRIVNQGRHWLSVFREEKPKSPFGTPGLYPPISSTLNRLGILLWFKST